MLFRIVRVSGVVLCLAAAHVTAASADATSDARKAIEARFGKMSAALNKRDGKAYTQFFAPNFVSIGERGNRQDSRQMSRLIDAVMKMSQSLKHTWKTEKFTLQSGKAIHTVRQDIAMTMTDPQTGRNASMRQQPVEEFTWTKGKSGWLITQYKTLSSKMSVNGKTMP
jgi:ketosteroid isomerase-like protein